MVTLDLERINSVASYVVMPTSDKMIFRFTTDYNVDYVIGFTPDELLAYDESYQFFIVNTNNRKSPRDFKLRQTVVAFIYEFFRRQDVVMLYLCETGDNKQLMRNRLFESWFRISSFRETSFVYQSADITDEEGVVNFVACIMRSDNPNVGQISAQFGESIQMFREKP